MKDRNTIGTVDRDDEEVMKVFMEKVGLDVFQFILSFLPPVPYLFQLQRVSKHYAQLCKSCMEEDCSEFYYDEEAVSQMNDQMKESSSNIPINSCLQKLMQTLKPSEKVWVLFFRDILHKFKKLNRLVLKNMHFSQVIMYIIFADWKGSLKELKLVECDFKLVIPSHFVVNGGTLLRLEELYTQVERFSDCKLDQDSYQSYGFMTDIQQSINITQIETIKIVSKSFRNDMNYPFFGYSLIPFVKCFPSLKSVSCAIFRNRTPVWESAQLLFPDIDFTPLPRELTDEMTNLDKFYRDYLCKEFNLRKNRLELIQEEFTNRKSREDIHNFYSAIIEFLEVYVPFGLDSLIKDVRGNNIIQLAILFTNFEVVKFIVRYLTVIEKKKDATKELSQLISSNNRLDGRNALFGFTNSSSNMNYFHLLMEYGVSFNFPSNDGSTILHYLCAFGQLAKLKSIWDDILKGKTLSEKKYYLNFNLKNKNGETPLYLCKKNGMRNMAQHLQSQAELYGIDLDDESKVSPGNIIHNPSTVMVQPVTQNTSSMKCDIL